MYRIPQPILDKKEQRLLRHLNTRWNKFKSPGAISQFASTLGEKVKETFPPRNPEFPRERLNNLIGMLNDPELVKWALNSTEQGFHILFLESGRLTLSPKHIQWILSTKIRPLKDYKEIILLRSYFIEKQARWMRIRNRILGTTDGFGTGILKESWGIAGDIAVFIILAFRISQLTALFYGYDVTSDDHELLAARDVTLAALSPYDFDAADESLTWLDKMMRANSCSELARLIDHQSYSQLVKKKGLSAAYARLRAQARKQDRDTASKTRTKSISQVDMIANLIKQLAQPLTQRKTIELLLLIGGLIGGGFNLYFTDQVIRGANMLYHKRFLLEKEIRIKENFA